MLALAFTGVVLHTFVIPHALTPASGATTGGSTGPTASETASEDASTQNRPERPSRESRSSSRGSSTDGDAAPSAQTSPSPDSASSSSNDDAVITDLSYEDDEISITIETIRVAETDVYVAEITVSDPQLLKAALANDTYGRNISQTTSEIAGEHGAILAINGDYYGFRDSGYVVRDGVTYRDSANDTGLVIDENGDFTVIDETTTPLSEIVSDAWQVFSFGPALVEDGEVVVDANDEVSQSMRSNPRTAIGQIGTGHYLMVVSDGRTDASAGLSLAELAQVFADHGAVTAYNLDGGGSATMVFNGQVVNNPTSGRGIKEREVSDIVYIGY
jgi:exopolysaccharide biosynthesis protein